MSWWRQLAYRLVYQPFVNKVLRNLNRAFAPILPASWHLPPSGIMVVQLKTGSFRFATNQTNTTSQFLFWRGPYKIEYTIIFEDLIKRCNCFYDIGAHAGYYSLIAATVNPRCNVIAFEPAAGPYHYLVENIRINKLHDRVHAKRLALGNWEGEVTFLEVVHDKYKYLEHNLVAVGNLATPQPNRTMKETRVPATTLDAFVSSHPDMKPDIIKIDTEGTEHLILAGGTRLLETKPIVISETLFKSNEQELESIMKKQGYRFYNYKDSRLREVSTIVRATDDGVHDCFFVHPAKAELISPYLA
jgi:FkbM family methyltransferase